MEFLNVGLSELVIILVIIFIVLKPDDLVKTGQKIGATIRKIRNSDGWNMMTNTQRGLRNLPNILADETGFEYEELKKDLLGEADTIKQAFKETEDGLSSWRAPLEKTANELEQSSGFNAWTTPSSSFSTESFPSISPTPKEDNEPDPTEETPDKPE
jgi:Sec-independent protein translocase protein TatA